MERMWYGTVVELLGTALISQAGMKATFQMTKEQYEGNDSADCGSKVVTPF